MNTTRYAAPNRCEAGISVYNAINAGTCVTRTLKNKYAIGMSRTSFRFLSKNDVTNAGGLNQYSARAATKSWRYTCRPTAPVTRVRRIKGVAKGEEEGGRETSDTSWSA